MKWLRGKAKYIIVLGAAAAAIGYAAGTRGLAKRVGAPTMVVTRGLLQSYVEDTGKVQVAEEILIFAPLGGRIESLAVRVGDPVERGQTVARLTQDQETVAKAGLAKAQVRLAEARRAEETSRGLFEKGAISESEYNRARAELRVAEDDLRIAEAQYETAAKLGQTTLVAPETGTILEVFAKERQVLSPGAPVASMGDLGKLEVRAELLTYDAVNVAVGQKATISGAVLKGKVVEGTVKQVHPKAVTRVSSLGLEQQRVPVIIELDGDPGPVKPGFDVDVRIETGITEGVLVVPKSALFQKGRDSCVYVVENGVARARLVEIGLETGEAAEITSGLAEGDVIVVEPGVEVKDGTRIAVP
ncbi:MAG: efflux RND transporter periplasmic adaptor subunit [Firmicutes bacterium]|nr:efflux RND transporter periplasmic adaptor subunit [Bacillota bacterium]